jgi:hypothetical protein
MFWFSVKPLYNRKPSWFLYFFVQLRAYFQARTGAEHVFQVMMDADFEDADCFEFSYPVRVAGRSFLSQLI